MVCNNITTIELAKKQGIGYACKNQYKSIYDLGFYANWKEVFGSPYTLFLWGPSGDGVTYKRRVNIKDVEASYYYEDDMEDL